MRPIPIPASLDADFGERIEALRAEADARGHTDIGCILEMAAQIADKRISAGVAPPPVADSTRMTSAAQE